MKLALLISTIYGGLSGEDIKIAVKKILGAKNLEHTIINPLFGHMFKVNGCLESIRFYSSELEIEYDDKGERIYSKDDSINSLINLLILLFPSHTGFLNNFRCIDVNFTNKYFIDNEDERIANIKKLGSMFARLVKKQTDENIQKPKKNTKDLFKFLEYHVLYPSDALDLDSEILKLLTINEFAVVTADTANEMEVYLQSIVDNLEDEENTIIRLELTEGQKKLFEDLYDNPF